MVNSPKKKPRYYFILTTLTTTLISVFFIFFVFPSSSYHKSSLPLNPNFNSKTVFSNNNNFTFIIKVLAYNRLDSLSRCLRSLSSARYGGDTVHLHLHLDHFPLPPSSTPDLDQKLHESRQILEFVDGFRWDFGDKVVHYRTGNVGLQAQWLEAWWPASDREFAFVVEDDLEVSPRFYEFVKGVIVNYYLDSSNFSPFVYGVSLQRPRFVPGTPVHSFFLLSSTIRFSIVMITILVVSSYDLFLPWQ